MDRDWTVLPPDAVQLMSKKLFSMSDFIRLRASCKTWRNSVSPPSDLPPLLPWLILPRGLSTANQDANLGQLLSMYDLSESRTHILHVPEIQGERICGSSHGWLVLEWQRQVSLLNPITRDFISLPSLFVRPNTFPEYTKGAVIQNYHGFCIKKAILSSNPRIDPDNCFVMALFEGSWETAFCKIGDGCWTTVLVQGSTAAESPTVDIGYHKNRFYAICRNGNAWICNISDLTLNRVSSTLEGADELPEPLVCTVDGRGAEHRFMMFFVPQLIGGEKKLRMLSEDQESSWTLVNQEHSDSIIFLGGFFHSIAIPAANVRLDGWKGGSICAINFYSLGLVSGLDRRQYTWRIVRSGIDGNAVFFLPGNQDAFVETDNDRRLLEGPYLFFFVIYESIGWLFLWK